LLNNDTPITLVDMSNPNVIFFLNIN
jgi:hypothetical protein